MLGFLTDEKRFREAGQFLFFAILICWGTLSIVAALRQGTWADEASYIVKSWWYISGSVTPYTAEDSTWYQPLIFYALGTWQWIVGHDIISSRLLSVLITATNIALLIFLLFRLSCTTWPIVLATVTFALTEDSIFYFSSATPYSYAVCLQLVAFHIVLGMRRRASLTVALALGITLSMIYFLRINLVSFIALILGVVGVRAGRDRWLVYFCSAAIFLLTWSLLALLWGRQFSYITSWLPGVTDWLVQAGLLPKLYPHVSLSRQMLLDSNSPAILVVLGRAFSLGMVRDWIVAHHVVPILVAVLATALALKKDTQNRGWIALFVNSYWVMLIFHHLGAQSYCPICIQAYANYFNYLAALAGGLSLQSALRKSPDPSSQRGRVVSMTVILLALAAAQSWSLSGSNKLPSIRNRADSLPDEVTKVGYVLNSLLPPGSRVEFVGRDPRIQLALARAGIRFPPITLALTSSYRKLNGDLSPEQVTDTLDEIRQLTMWTDEIAKEWIQYNGDWIVVQQEPVDHVFPWLIWSPSALFLKRGLENCFEQVAYNSFDTFEPPLSFALYRRTKNGKTCLGE